MATMQCDIVSAEEEIFSGEVTMVIATGTLGELGIMPGHAPLLTGIKPGPVRLQFADAEEEVFFASGGFLEIQPSVVTILADTAVRAADLDEAAAESARAEAERHISDRDAEFEFGAAQAQLAEIAGQLRTISQLRKRGR